MFGCNHGAGRIFPADTAAIHIIREQNFIIQRIGSHRTDVSEIHPDADITFVQAGNQDTGSAELEVNGNILPLREHQPPVGKRILCTNKFDGDTIISLGYLRSLHVVYIEPEYDGNQQRQGDIQHLVGLLTHLSSHHPSSPSAGSCGDWADRASPHCHFPMAAAARCAEAAPVFPS